MSDKDKDNEAFFDARLEEIRQRAPLGVNVGEDQAKAEQDAENEKEVG